MRNRQHQRVLATIVAGPRWFSASHDSVPGGWFEAERHVSGLWRKFLAADRKCCRKQRVLESANKGKTHHDPGVHGHYRWRQNERHLRPQGAGGGRGEHARGRKIIHGLLFANRGQVGRASMKATRMKTMNTDCEVQSFFSCTKANGGPP